MFFWQTDEEVEEARTNRRGHRLWRRKQTSTELSYAFWDISAGMLVNNLVMYFIILATGATLFQHGHTHIKSAADAAQALQPVAGNAASWLFAAGLISAGFLAAPVMLTSSAYTVAQVLGWRHGLDYKPHQARQFYGVLITATLIAALLNFLNINSMDALFWVSILDGLLAPPLLVIIMLVSNNKKLMGDRVNSRFVNVLGWTTTLIMFVAAAAMILLQITGINAS